jgi:hypothetical protein
MLSRIAYVAATGRVGAAPINVALRQATRAPVVAPTVVRRATNPSQAVTSVRHASTRTLPTLPPWLTIAAIRKYSPQIAAVGGAVLVVYGLSRTMVYVTSSILSLDMYDLFYAGFWTGIVGAAVFGAGGLYLWRIGSISPRVALRRALSKVQTSSRAREALGGNIQPGTLKAYTVYNGHLSLAKKLAWVEPRTQLLFHVRGDSGEGMVTAEAVKHKGSLIFNLIALDTMAKAGKPSQLLLLKGSEDRLHVQGQLRGFLQTDRASFIQQDKVEDDDARVSEQETLPTEDLDETPTWE